MLKLTDTGFTLDGNPITYAAGIRVLRRLTGWNTKALGVRLGVSGRTIENWEQGRTTPQRPHILLLRQLV